MTKGELIRLLEPFTDDIEILVDLTREFAIMRPIEAVAYVTHPTDGAEIHLMVGQ